MSRLYVNKFLYQIDRDPELLAAYKSDPGGLVSRWETEIGPWMDKQAHLERISWLRFTDDERAALVARDHVALFELGAHYFVTLQVFMGLFDRDWEIDHGPLSYQKSYARDLEHWRGRRYPDVGL